MAINGMLSDIGFVALLQFPNSSRKTGLLQVTSKAGKAVFYYDNGRLIHASLGDVTGRDVLVDVVEWTDGSFIFEPGLVPDEITIKNDLHQTLMWALKERDERNKDKQETSTATQEIDPGLCIKLDELLKADSSIEYICIISSQGTLVARSECSDEFYQEIEPFIESVSCFISSYPGGEPGKVFIEDRKLTMALSGLNDKQTVLLVNRPGMSLGRLAMSLGKIIRDLKGE